MAMQIFMLMHCLLAVYEIPVGSRYLLIELEENVYSAKINDLKQTGKIYLNENWTIGICSNKIFLINVEFTLITQRKLMLPEFNSNDTDASASAKTRIVGSLAAGKLKNTLILFFWIDKTFVLS